MTPKYWEEENLLFRGKNATYVLCLFSCCLSLTPSYSRQTSKPISISGSGNVNWNVSLEQTHKVFIENKGQFPDKAILYQARVNGVNICFNSSGLRYSHTEFQKKSEQESEEMEEAESKGETSSDSIDAVSSISERQKEAATTSSLQIHFNEASTSVQVMPEEKVSNYFTYPDTKDTNGTSTIRARAFKKIIYQNIYPNIDIEYFFPDNKPGIKYNVILHPGADPGRIQMRYDEAKNISSDASGNIIIESAFGEFIEHAPYTSDEQGQLVNSSFKLTGNLISFMVDTSAINNKSGLLIDPWITIPSFSGGNKAYDIAKDNYGNVYCYGGDIPFQLMKFDKTGSLIWTNTITNTVIDQCSWGFGDFSVDENGSSYITISPFGGIITKIDSQGNLDLFTTNNDKSIGWTELWRNTLDCRTGSLIVGGNIQVLGTGGRYVYENHIALADTINCSISLVTEFLHKEMQTPRWEVKSMITNGSGSVYTLHQDGRLIKSSTTDFKIDYVVQGGTNNLPYEVIYCDVFGVGTNALAVNSKYVYTYDGEMLFKINESNGAIIDSCDVVDGLSAGNSGITLDPCGNIYVGATNGVRQYDSSLRFIALANTKDTVYDVSLGEDGEILACGRGFVSSLSFPNPCSSSINLTTGTTASSCFVNDGTASAIANNESLTYSYQWSPSRQTTATASDLAPGNYNVRITGYVPGSCITALVEEKTVTVSKLPNPVIFAGHDTLVCQGEEIKLAASGGLTYEWQANSALNSSSLMNPVALMKESSEFVVTGKNVGGCIGTDTVTVEVKKCPDGIYIPNSFTPNADNNNDKLYVYGSGIKSISVKIFNRWGELVFETVDINEGWDGTYQGKTPVQDVYIYKLSCIWGNSDVKDLTGRISLIK